MVMEEAIERALLTHGAWKRRLATVIENDGEGLSVEEVSSDSQCEFGKWLCIEVSVGEQRLPIFERARKLHAEFHLEAGRVLALAQSKRRSEAMEAIEPTSEFVRISGALTLVLEQWRFRTRRATQELPIVQK